MTGLYKEYLIFTSTIIIHELGHIISSTFVNWDMISIELNIYGGNIKYKEFINKPLIEEFIVAISGIIIQSLYFLVLFFLYKKGFIDNRIFIMIANYNYSIILFNLLPIPPLDGYKVLNIFSNFLFPYKKSLNLCPLVALFVFLLFIFWVLLNNIGGNSSVILILLVLKLFDEYKNKEYKFNKFLLERYLYAINFKRIKKLKKGINSMYRDYNHIFIVNDKNIEEKNILKLHFKN